MMELTLNSINAELRTVQNHTAGKLYDSMRAAQYEQVENFLKSGASLTYIDSRDNKNALERAWDLNDVRLMPLIMNNGTGAVANDTISLN